MKKVTVQDYAKLTGVSHTIVYRKIKKGELATKTEMINNRETTVILVDDNEILQEPHISNSFKQFNETPNETIETQFETVSETPIGVEFIGDIIQDNKEMRRELLELSKKYMETAQLAGQAKLLTDSEHETKNQYFQLVQENKILIKENIKLETTTSILTEQIEDLKKGANEKATLKAKLETTQEQLETLQKKLQEIEGQRKGLIDWFNKL